MKSRRTRAQQYRRLTRAIAAAEDALCIIDAMPAPLVELPALEQLRDQVRLIHQRKARLDDAQAPTRAMLAQILQHDPNDLLVAELGSRLREVCGL